MRLIFTTVFMVLLTVGYAQTDSTEIKLKHYKEMYSNGIIDSSEYKALRQRLLGISDNKPTQQPVTVVLSQATIDTFGMTSEQLFKQGMQDALDNYRHGPGITIGTLAATVFGSPLIGLAPAIGCSTSFNEANADYPNMKKAKNPDYKLGYMKEVRHIKRISAWGGWGAGTAIDIVVGIVVGTIISHHK